MALVNLSKFLYCFSVTKIKLVVFALTSIIYLIANICLAIAQDGEIPGSKKATMLVKIVDEENQPFAVNKVMWRYVGDRGKEHELLSSKKPSSEWMLEFVPNRPVVIQAITSKVLETDPYCWKIYFGEVVLKAAKDIVTIEIKYRGTVCANQKAD